MPKPKKRPRDAPKNKEPKLLTTYAAVVDTLGRFLTVVTHYLLYLRKVYPPVSFMTTKAYNFPVMQSRHPEVRLWIRHAINAIKDQLRKCTVEKVAICIFEEFDNEVVERWTIDLAGLPRVFKKDRLINFDIEDNPELKKQISVPDLNQSFRGLLTRLTSISQKMKPLPDGDLAPDYSFTLTIEIKDGANAPVGLMDRESDDWIVAEPNPFIQDNDSPTPPPIDDDTSAFLKKVFGSPTQSPSNDTPPTVDKVEEAKESKPRENATIPIRRIEAGVLRLEMYVEESELKSELPTTYKSTKEKADELSYGGFGEVQFDDAYDTTGWFDEDEADDTDNNRKPPKIDRGWLDDPVVVEGTDIHRKPAGGAF